MKNILLKFVTVKKNASLLLLFILLLTQYSCREKENSLFKNSVGNVPVGMVWIPPGVYLRGANIKDINAREDEKPQHTVSVNGFWMDVTEVTNAQFRKFVDQTGYITVAEREVDWEELKKQLPEGVEKPHDSVLQPGSLSFECKLHEVKNLNDYSQWWNWKLGVNWKHPEGKESTIKGRDNYPVVHISYEDAIAYCNWLGRRLPTEAEWEYAARGGLDKKVYTWGDNDKILNSSANTWQGIFPTKNTKEDGYERSSPVKSYPANGYGLYDMAGNVWEWTQDWYDFNYYKELAKNKKTQNPLGPKKASNPNNPYAQEKVIRGGSFLCHDSYCASYRVSARMATSFDTGLEHLGFRTVLTAKMVSN